MVAEIRQLELDRQLLDALPEDLREQWYKYRPEGQIDADVNLRYDGQHWDPRLTLRCVNLSFTHYKFPYRLEHGKGTFSLADDLLQAHLTAYSGNREVQMDAQVRHPTSGPIGWIEAKGDNIPLDERLLDALPEKPHELARSLDLRGAIGFRYRLEHRTPEEPPHQCLSIDVSRCWLRYEKFPYSLTDIHGTLEMVDGRWTFSDLQGTNGTTRVICGGSLTPTPQGNELALQFRAIGVPLEEELRDALGPSMRQIWKDLRPRGMIDLTAEVRYVDQLHQLNVSVRAAAP